mmetsp:Transcript_12907/g.23199  ORF Transcript_12907/g.23199 Transcript_12907/m.23199 type:complete len:363 (-) Transcript_12907:1891-2979(-)
MYKVRYVRLYCGYGVNRVIHDSCYREFCTVSENIGNQSQSIGVNIQSSFKHPPFVYHESYSVTPWDPKHRFVMSKFRCLYETLVNNAECYDSRLLNRSPPLNISDLYLAHDPNYVQKVITGTLSSAAIRKTGLPLNSGVIQRTLYEVSGTILSASLALQHGLGMHLAGGTHHAHASFGAGFCYFNDVAVAASKFQQELGGTVLIVDLDVHQGDGTARIFERNEHVFTISIHGQNNWPIDKAVSDIDVGLPDGTGDEEYILHLEQTLLPVLDTIEPCLAFYNAGADVHKDDALGKLSLTDDGMIRRDQFVLSELLSRRIPTAVVIGGGYHRNSKSVIQRHAITHQTACRIWKSRNHKINHCVT